MIWIKAEALLLLPFLGCLFAFHAIFSAEKPIQGLEAWPRVSRLREPRFGTQ